MVSETFYKDKAEFLGNEDAPLCDEPPPIATAAQKQGCEEQSDTFCAKKLLSEDSSAMRKPHLSSQAKGVIALFFAAALWGTTWVAQKYGATEIGPFTFVAIRSFFAFVTLACVAYFRRKTQRVSEPFLLNAALCSRKVFSRRIALCAVSGVSFMLGIFCQQIALVHLSVGTTAFITAFYVVLIPVCSVLLHKRVPSVIWVAACIAVVGLYFLTIDKGFKINPWALVALLGAASLVAQVMSIDAIVSELDFVEITMALFAFCFLSALMGSLFFESVSLGALVQNIGPLVYSGTLGGGIAFVLQTYGQKTNSPSVAGITMSLEGLFAPATAFIVLGEIMSGREILGGCILLVGVLVAQIRPSRGKSQTVE